MASEGGQTMQEVCGCRSLDDLVKAWDVRWSVPRIGADAATGHRDKDAAGRTGGDLFFGRHR